MSESIRFVIKEHINNIYRILSIAKYEKVSENRDTNLGGLWNALNPLIYISTYWFVFGVGIRNNKPVNGIPYLQWMLCGLIVWFFMSNCIRKSSNAISSKIAILEKMKFPISILPTTIILSQLFDHIIMFTMTYLYIVSTGYIPSIYNLKIVYYMFCGLAFCISFGLVFSVLSILVKDIKKIIPSVLRLLMYITPILWTMDNLSSTMKKIMRINPIYYVVEGYRDSLFGDPSFNININTTLVFWAITICLFVAGCILMNKYRYKLVDLG